MYTFLFFSLCSIFESLVRLGFTIHCHGLHSKSVQSLFSQPRRHFGSGRGPCFSSKCSVTECNQILVSSYTGRQTSPSVSRRRFWSRQVFCISATRVEANRMRIEGDGVDGGKNTLNATRSSFPTSFSFLVCMNPQVVDTCHSDRFAYFLLQENHPVLFFMLLFAVVKLFNYTTFSY